MYLFSVLSEDDNCYSTECSFCFDRFKLGQLSKTFWKLLKRYCHNLLGLPKQNTIDLVAKTTKIYFLQFGSWKFPIKVSGENSLSGSEIIDFCTFSLSTYEERRKDLFGVSYGLIIMPSFKPYLPFCRLYLQISHTED